MIDWIFLLSIPLISAFIGWMTNWVAIRMLFHPQRPITILGYRWQGLIPKRQQEIASKTGEIVEREILSRQLLRKELDAVDFDNYIAIFATRVIQERLGEKLRAIPFLGGFINDATLQRLAELAGEEMRKQAPFLKAHLSNEMETRLPIRELVETRISEFDLPKLEKIVEEIAGKEFRAIELLGAVLGFVIGVLQLLILALTGQLAI
jgi:uncharacterized membrane protein YheB (UPF0754 family)